MTVPIWALVVSVFVAFMLGFGLCAILANQNIDELHERIAELHRQLQAESRRK